MAKDGCKPQEQVAGQAPGDRRLIDGKWFVAVAAAAAAGGIVWLIADNQNDDGGAGIPTPPLSP
jgi:hypothetical protein